MDLVTPLSISFLNILLFVSFVLKTGKGEILMKTKSLRFFFTRFFLFSVFSRAKENFISL